MKVTRDTPEQLIVEHKANDAALTAVFFPIILWCFFVLKRPPSSVFDAVLNVGLALCGGVIFLSKVERSQLILDRTTGTATLRQRAIFGYNEIIHDLREVSHAKTEPGTHPKQRSHYRPVIVLAESMSAGSHPITKRYHQGVEPQKISIAINRWLDSHRPAT
ncbi:hypothetical protein [Cognatishimia sp. MH4019]|uniref:hypothetical protein n=1 Tax=Cognatishimia sp. MH4019 TaxID=2854030 RepID=UPI001CD6F119|nr:hypothetical protein [Cognatishimia sp. MH4019]